MFVFSIGAVVVLLFFCGGLLLFINIIYLFIYHIISHNISFQPVLHDWCNKGRGMYYPVCEMMHIKEPFLLIEKRRQRVSSLAM